MRLFLIPVLLSGVLAVCACSEAQEYEAKVGVETEREPTADRSALATDAEPGALELENERIEFSHTWPAVANAIPALAARFEREAGSALAEAQTMAAEDQAAARADGYEFRPHSAEKEWETVAELPDWLSLSALIYSYTGGAHPNYGYDSLVWDKRANMARAPLDLFRSATAFKTALWEEFCAALDAERAERRGAPVDPASTDGFSTCPEPREVTVLLGSGNSQTFDRIGILIGPYVAGPYAEGSYEFTFPVDSAVIDAVKPDYVAAFSRAPQKQARNSAD
jgi:hypothetical protein